MMKAIVPPKSIIVDLPYKVFKDNELEHSINENLKYKRSDLDNQTIQVLKHYLLKFPTVYIVHKKEYEKYTVYVGETNNIEERTKQHLNADTKIRDDWEKLSEGKVKQYIIANEHFNKSLTLDVENRFMQYLLSVDSINEVTNRRTNPQGEYYPEEEFERIFSGIWVQLHDMDPDLFPEEGIIRDSALFKASPFHKLTTEQKSIESKVIDIVNEALQSKNKCNSDSSTLILLEGDAGTGKTVLLSDLFYKICNKLSKIKNQSLQYNYEDIEEGNDEEDYDHEYKQFSTINSRKTACIIVNHKEQVNVYNQIATKLRLQKNNDELVMLPSQFINRFSEQTEQGRGIIDRPKRCCDVALIDEAHLLNTQANQAYSGSNMLSDILCRSRVVIAAFDPNQILQSNQRWNSEDLEKLLGTDYKDKNSFKNDDDCGELLLNDSISVSVRRFILENQMRMRANENVLEWIKNFVYNGCIDTLPVCRNYETKKEDSNTGNKPFDFKVFDSPIKLFNAIKSKSEEKASGCDGHGLSRLVATYDWEYKSNKNNPNAVNGTWNVDLYCDNNGKWHIGLGPYANASSYELEILEKEGKVFSHPWNYQLSSQNHAKHSHSIKESKKSWAEQSHTINEIGSTFTIQGFDLNYAGVIIGPSVQYRNGKVVFCPENSRNDKATNKRHSKDLSSNKKITLDYSIDNLKNEINVLLKRGVNGLYVFAVDTELEKALLEAQRKRNSLI
ncbi:DUF2075 domain-containing protein [Gardnerella vaginalis]|uniref:GIY-YIG domain-containing protein n=1 Tax=Gardnerella vaginalis TaxID=2702 RepID=A0A133NTK5_GARVA|nr:DUF2075 domain-containing protein [Gardnerella vaginalis]EPI42416.1 hypothetical protein HMPREF1584_01013 [Gardnerella vaginalis JCP8481A]EPI44260.1 hypothetical protein HMPREF1585_00135 [Gardnerella vaginalis JCP8481B]KXA19625.1 hypothetical protein HMPREF3208_01037 [Gardnerella vaginalis]